MNIYDFSAKNIKGENVSLEKYRGQVVLIVNVASRCGFTPQYKGLEALYQKYKSQGFVILGFPCNQFGKQEPGSSGEIESFCEINFGVTFPLFTKVDVNGKNADPLFKALNRALPGFLGLRRIQWNFTKFLIDAQGNPIKRFAPNREPASLEADITALLSSQSH